MQFGVWVPFAVAAGVCFVALLPVFSAIPAGREAACGVSFNVYFIFRLRLSLTAMILCGFMEGALLTLIPVYALREGFGELETGLLLFGFMLGHGGLTPLIGMLGDRLGLTRMLELTYGLGAFSFILMMFGPAFSCRIILLLFGGASVGALYPLGVGLLGELLTAEELPRGNALTTFCYGIGSIAGPFVPAIIMHFTVPKSLFAVAVLLYCCVPVLMTVKQNKKS